MDCREKNSFSSNLGYQKFDASLVQFKNNSKEPDLGLLFVPVSRLLKVGLVQLY